MIRGSFSGSKLSLCILVVAALSGCKATEPRTQVMVVVDAEKGVQPKATSLRVEIEGRTLGTETYSQLSVSTYPPVDSEMMIWPYKIALVPRGGDEKREFRITATAFNGGDAIARLRAESGFVHRKTLELTLRFQAACLYSKSLDCPQTETCLDGGCVPSRVDQATLPMYTDEPTVNIPIGDGGPVGTTSNPALIAGTGVAVGSGGVSGGTAGGPDADPSMVCGDGMVTGDEKCDTAIPKGMAGECPTGCVAATACAPSRLEGSGCQTRCTPYKITALDSGDGCCPEGADANSDNDCRASCGNSTIEMGEACDPVEMCPTAATCVSANVCLTATVIGDASACTATCVMQPIIECMSGDGCCPVNCTNGNDADCSASCGDGIVSGSELCEPTSTEKPCPISCDDGNACTSDLSTGSAANCNAACTNVAITAPKRDDGCCPPGANANNDNDCQAKCGNNIVEPGERCDGRCPTAANCNDNNPCTVDALTGSGCTVQCTYTLIVLPANGDDCCPALLANATNDNDCSPVCGNGVVEDGERCDGNCPTASSCNDNQACTRDEVTGSSCQRQCNHPALGASGATKDGCCPGTGMTSDTDADCPPPQPPEPMCPNGKVETGEDCDGNCPTACNDSNACTADTSSNCKCAHSPLDKPPTGNGCCMNGREVTCCGNGTVESGEDCDGDCSTACNDTNSCTADTSSNCKCAHSPLNKPPTGNGCCMNGREVTCCGNGTVESGEDCDGDCSTACNDTNSCTADTSSNCKCAHSPLSKPPTGDACCVNGSEAPCPPECGNRVMEAGEACDDGNTVSGDGCSSSCTIETLPP